ncbi:MAG: MFS transporter, partial [Candidatus Adiutrix sp.]
MGKNIKGTPPNHNLESSPSRLWTVGFFTFVMLNFFVFMGFDILLPTLSLFLQNWGASESEIGRIFSVFTISAVFFRMVTGYLSSRFKPMNMVYAGLMLCAGAALYYYWATSVSSGMLARLIHGAGFGLASTLITSLASQIIPPARMGEGLGYLGLGTTAALALGPFFGLWLVQEFGYLVLFITVALFYVLGIIGAMALPEIKLPPTAPGALKPRLVLISPKVLAPSFLMFLVGLILSSTIVFMALYCQERNLLHAGYFFVISTIGIFISRFTTGRIHDRFGHRYVLIPASLMLLTSMLLLAFTHSAWLFFCAAITYGLSTGAIFPSTQALAFSAVPNSERTE